MKERGRLLMAQVPRLLGVACLVLALEQAPACATIYRHATQEDYNTYLVELVARSALVVAGHVTASHSNSTTGILDITLAIDDYIKGEAVPGDTLVYRTFNAMPSMGLKTPGSRCVLALYRCSDGMWQSQPIGYLRGADSISVRVRFVTSYWPQFRDTLRSYSAPPSAAALAARSDAVVLGDVVTYPHIAREIDLHIDRIYRGQALIDTTVILRVALPTGGVTSTYVVAELRKGQTVLVFLRRAGVSWEPTHPGPAVWWLDNASFTLPDFCIEGSGTHDLGTRAAIEAQIRR